VSVRQIILRELALPVQQLFEELVNLGVHTDAVKRLGEVALRLESFLAQVQPADLLVLTLWNETESVLHDLLASLVQPETPEPAAREGFWK
jgi:hypothetical protein